MAEQSDGWSGETLLAPCTKMKRLQGNMTKYYYWMGTEENIDEGVEVQQATYDPEIIKQLLTHVPDNVINYTHRLTMPAMKEYIGVAMFADISGFTSLCERYAEKSTSGTDKLTATLNSYIGKIVDVIIKDGGDVLKFAGDAILASWRFNEAGSNIQSVLSKVIKCSHTIQHKCDNEKTEVGVTLRVKIALAVGTMSITFVGMPESKQFDLSGSAIDDVGKAEKKATPGDVIITQLAWLNCDQSRYQAEEMEDGIYFKVSEDRKIVDKTAFSVGQSIAGVTGLFNNALIATAEKVIICPEMDALIEECADCQMGLPKAFLADPEEMEDRRPLRGNEGKASDKKRKKFDRLKMDFNLNDNEVSDLRAYVPKPVLDKVDNGQDLEWLSEMRQVSVLFINMKLPDGKEEAAQGLQKAFEIIYEAASKFKGNLNKVFSFDKGCTFILIFGLPGEKYEDDAARALRCGHSIYENLHAVSEITDESIGVTTGRAFCGVVGHKDRHEYTVIGRKVNMAARLMTNYPGKLSCDPETYEASKRSLNRWDFTALPFKTLKGIKDPGIIREYNPTVSQQIEREQEYDYPILGRQTEIDEFTSILKKVKVRGNTGNIVVIEGEAGIGKTRLLEELMDIAEIEGYRCDFVEVDLSQSGSPFHVVTTLIVIMLKLEDCRTSSEKESKLFEVITDEGILEDLCLLNALLGTQVLPNPKFAHMDDSERNISLHHLMFRIVHLITEDQPCLFAIDNAHYIDSESWEFFEDFTKESHAVLALALRPFSVANPAPCEAALRILNHTQTKRFTIGGLPPNVLADLACQFLEVSHIPKKLDQILRSRSHGVASWCEQLIKDMLMTQVIQVIPVDVYEQQEDHYKQDKKIAALAYCKRRVRSSVNVISALKKMGNLVIPGLLIPDENTEKPVTNPNDSTSDDIRLDKLARGSVDEQKTKSNLSLGDKRSSFSRRECRESYEYDRRRRLSTCSGKSEHSYDLSAIPEKEEVSKLHVVDNSPDSGLLFELRDDDYVRASENVLPFESNEICIISPGVDIEDVIVPNTVKDLVIARLDRMSPNEQLILKCASILGMSFTRDLLRAIIPQSSLYVLDRTLYNLSKEGVLECGSLSQASTDIDGYSGHHSHQHKHHSISSSSNVAVLCGCYASEGLKVLNLSQSNHFSDGKKRICLYFHFCNMYVQEGAYALWLEDQRKAIHEKAALYLESQSNTCKACGGTAFLPENKAVMGGTASRSAVGSAFMDGKLSAPTSVRLSSLGGSSKKSFRTILNSHKGNLNPLTRTTNDLLEGMRQNTSAGSYSTQTTTGTRGEGIGRALVDMAGLVTQNVLKDAHSKKSWRSYLSFVRPRTNKVAPDVKVIARTLLAEFRTHFEDQLRRRSNRQDPSQHSVDLSKCQCLEILALTYSELVRNWKLAENKLKTFQYLVEAGATNVALHSNMQSLSYLHEAQAIIKQQDEGDDEDTFVVTDIKKARVDCLIGQAYLDMNRTDEAKTYFVNALKRLGRQQPKTATGVMKRTFSAYMTQLLHRKMPNVFVDRSEEEVAHLNEQSRCLSHLSHLYHLDHDYKRCFMTALEQLNAAEESNEDWKEGVF